MAARACPSLIKDAIADPSVSHVLAFKRDRLGRPDEPVEMMQIEGRLLKAGITVVRSDGRTTPTSSRSARLANQLTMLIDYDQAGKYLEDLAEQVIKTQLIRARYGHSTGGTPPYGFARALVDAAGKVLEILPQGKQVRQPGCHVVFIPYDWEKLAVWLQILEWKERGWGYKRIVNELNSRRIPSPGADWVRTDHGRRHRVTGEWSTGTVKALCENRIILGVVEYGRRSFGKNLRAGRDGQPQPLTDADFREDGKPKIVRHGEPLVATKTDLFDPLFDAARWDAINQETKSRGGDQSGIPKARDLSNYPLSCRLYDLSDDCGSVLYGMKVGERRIYRCGRYNRGGAAVCNNNQVDGEAMLRFVLQTLKGLRAQAGSTEELRRRLTQIAEGEAADSHVPELQVEAQLQGRQAELQHQLETIRQNLALETDPDIREEIRRVFKRTKEDLQAVEASLRRTIATNRPNGDMAEAVEKAMALFDRFDAVAENPSARAEIPTLLRDLGINIGLRFQDAIKGRKRKVRKLVSGVMTFGNAPVIEPDDGRDGEEERYGDRHGGGAHKHLARNEKGPARKPVLESKRPEEGVSFTKVNRGGGI